VLDPETGGCDAHFVAPRVCGVGKEEKPSWWCRNGYDFAERFPLAAAAIRKLPVRSCLIDGESSPRPSAVTRYLHSTHVPARLRLSACQSGHRHAHPVGRCATSLPGAGYATLSIATGSAAAA
jgi:hypothetical protein